MKLDFLLSLIVACCLLISCGGDESFLDENPVDIFPKKYIYEGIDFKPSDFFLIDENNIEQIYPETEPFTIVDNILLEEYFGEEGIYFSFREIILLSDSIARMKIVAQDSGEEANPEFPYEVNENKFRFYFSPDPLDFITLTFDEDNNRFVSCLQSHIFIHKNREFEGLSIDGCTSENKNEIIEELVNRERNNEMLQEKDTLILNISDLVLELEE